jgi:hypothetical protein
MVQMVVVVVLTAIPYPGRLSLRMLWVVLRTRTGVDHDGRSSRSEKLRGRDYDYGNSDGGGGDADQVQ